MAGVWLLEVNRYEHSPPWRVQAHSQSGLVHRAGQVGPANHEEAGPSRHLRHVASLLGVGIPLGSSRWPADVSRC